MRSNSLFMSLISLPEGEGQAQVLVQLVVLLQVLVQLLVLVAAATGALPAALSRSPTSE